MSYTYYQAKNPTTININDEHVTESELPERLLELNNKTQNILRIPGTDEDPTSHTEIDGVSFKTTLERISNTEGTLTKVSYDPTELLTTISGKLVTDKLNGNKIGPPTTFLYSEYSPYIPVCDTNGVTELSRYLDFHNIIDSEDYKVRLACSGTSTLRIFGPTTDSGTLETNVIHLRTNGDTVRVRIMTNGFQNMSVYNTAGTFIWVMDADGTNGLERWSTTRINAAYASTRTTAMTYTAGTPNNTTIAGDLTVTGSIHGTLAGSQTITHKTKYIGTITPGCFVESTGQIYREPPKVGTTNIWNEPTEEGQQGYYTTTQIQSLLSPYENCISIVRQATAFSSNIIGVCTEVIDHEFCKFATHGDCLIKCESATYTCGDIIVPSTNGFGKKGSSTDVLNCMLSMTPRLKVTSVDTDEIDPQCVVGFITV